MDISSCNHRCNASSYGRNQYYVCCVRAEWIIAISSPFRHSIGMEIAHSTGVPKMSSIWPLGIVRHVLCGAGQSIPGWSRRGLNVMSYPLLIILRTQEQCSRHGEAKRRRNRERETNKRSAEERETPFKNFSYGVGHQRRGPFPGKEIIPGT